MSDNLELNNSNNTANVNTTLNSNLILGADTDASVIVRSETLKSTGDNSCTPGFDDTGCTDANEKLSTDKTQLKKEPKYKFDRSDTIMLPVIFILSFLCVKYYNLGTEISSLGIGATAYIILYVISVNTYAKLKSVKPSKESMLLSILIILLALSFTLIYNYSLNILMQATMNFMLIYLPLTVFTRLIKQETSEFILFDYFNALIFIPLRNIASFWLCIFSKKEGSSRKKRSKYLVQVFLGLLVGTPLILIVIFLLSSADAVFNKIFDNLFTFDIDIPVNFMVLLWSLPMSTYLYALIYGSCVEKNTKYDTDKLNKNIESAAFIPRLSIYTVNTVICCFYLIFICIQALYFTDISGGSLPADFTYSEYARRGFFELVTIALINITFIGLTKVFSVRRANNKYMHIHIILNSILTLLLICVAFAKMFLYIRTYGLTTLRIIPSVFMLFLCFVFTFIISAELKRGFPVVKLSFYTGSILFVLLCLVNIDGIVARYNLNAYLNNKLPHYDIYSLDSSSLAAIPVIYDEWKKTDDVIIKDNLGYVAQDIIDFYSIFGSDNYNYAKDKALKLVKAMNKE